MRYWSEMQYNGKSRFALRILVSNAAGIALLGFLYGMGIKAYGIPLTNPSIADYVPIDTTALIAIGIILAALVSAIVPRTGFAQLSSGLSTSAAALYALGISWQIANPQTSGMGVYAALLVLTLLLAGIEFRTGFIGIRNGNGRSPSDRSSTLKLDRNAQPSNQLLRIAQVARAAAPAAGAWVVSSQTGPIQLLLQGVAFAVIGGVLAGGASAHLGSAVALLAAPSNDNDPHSYR